MVLVRAIDADGFVFYTNRTSAKGVAIAATRSVNSRIEKSSEVTVLWSVANDEAVLLELRPPFGPRQEGHERGSAPVVLARPL